MQITVYMIEIISNLHLNKKVNEQVVDLRNLTNFLQFSLGCLVIKLNAWGSDPYSDKTDALSALPLQKSAI